MADRLAKKYGTEDDKVNCPFYYKIGACRHGDSCTRQHNKPPLSQTLLFFHIYQNPRAAIAFSEGITVPKEDLLEAAQHFEEFYEEVFMEFCKYGEVIDMIVADNIGEHMLGNLYLKYGTEEQAENCLRSMNGKLYNNNQILVEFSPVTDFGEAKCRQYIEGQCERGGYCNFIHPKHIDKQLKKDLKQQMYKEYPQYLERKEEDKDGRQDKNIESVRQLKDDKYDRYEKERSRGYQDKSRDRDPRDRRYNRERGDYRDRGDYRRDREDRDRHYRKNDYRGDYRDTQKYRERDQYKYQKREEHPQDLERRDSKIERYSRDPEQYKQEAKNRGDKYSQREASNDKYARYNDGHGSEQKYEKPYRAGPIEEDKPKKRNGSEESIAKNVMRMNSEERRAMFQKWNEDDEKHNV